MRWELFTFVFHTPSSTADTAAILLLFTAVPFWGSDEGILRGEESTSPLVLYLSSGVRRQAPTVCREALMQWTAALPVKSRPQTELASSLTKSVTNPLASCNHPLIHGILFQGQSDGRHFILRILPRTSPDIAPVQALPNPSPSFLLQDVPDNSLSTRLS